jgi:uncharacterized protein YjdB
MLFKQEKRMKKSKSRILFYPILIMTLVLSWQKVSAQELTETDSVVEAMNDTFTYEYEGQTLEYKILTLADEALPGSVMVVGKQINTELTGELHIPTVVIHSNKSYEVSEIGNNAFDGILDITSVYIPEGVTRIGERAFSNCESLESIDLPEGLLTIADLAFSNCISLKNVKLPSKISSISWVAFQGTNIIFLVEKNTNAASLCLNRRYTYNYITVSEIEKVAIDSIRINPIFQQSYEDKLQLYIGDIAKFTVSYFPNNTTERKLTWTSSNTAIAKVSSTGTVTAVSSGSATITATGGTKTAKMLIIVNPDSPKSVKATSTGIKSITIKWDRVRNAKNYRVYRATSKTGTYKKIADVNTLSYEDTGLEEAKTYYYKVKAYGYIGGLYSSSHNSSKTSAKTKIGKLELLLADYVSNNSINLLLGYVQGAKGFDIYRSTTANGTYKLIKSVSSSASSYTDKTLSKGKTYFYKVKAYNYVNKIKTYSSYSKTVSASTKLPSYVTFGTSKKNVYKILGSPYDKYYYSTTHTYELYYKKNFMSGPNETAAIYLQKINGEWIVVGWSNLYKGLEVSDGYETNKGYFTLGSSMEEVNKVMATPFNFEYFYGGTYYQYQIRVLDVSYMYGSTITFDDNMNVIGWKNINGALKVKYGSDKPTYSQITIGTPMEQVLKALGTPDSLRSSGYPLDYPMYLTYGKTTLTFDENLELAGWSNKNKVNISIGKIAVTSGKVKVGTTLNEIIKIMGTPDSYIVDPNYPSSLNYIIYGNKVYNFDDNKKVSSIQNK